MPRISRPQLIALLGVIAAALACGIYWWRLTESQEQLRLQTIAQIEQRSVQLTEAVAGQTAILTRLIDFAIHHLRDAFSEGTRPAFESSVKTILNVFPKGAVLQIGVINAEGYLIYSSLGQNERLYLGDREHFKVHAGTSADELFVSRPVLGRVSKAWSIQFSRPIRKQDRFGGVVVLSIAPEYIAANLAVPALGRDDVISLFRPDGSYLSRSTDLADALGKTTPLDRPFVGVNAPAQGTLRVAAAFDQVHRTYAWRRLDDFPLVVAVGLGETEILGPVDIAMAAERKSNAMGIAVVMALAVCIAVLMVGASARQQALAKSERLHRTLFETLAEGVIVVEYDGRIVAWNDAALTILGVDVEGLQNRRARVSDAGGQALAAADFPGMGVSRGERLEHKLYSVARDTGELVWITVSSRSLGHEDNDEFSSAVVSFSDITRLVDAEESLKLAQSVFEAAMEGVIVTDAENRIVAVNPAFSNITGYSAAEAVGRNPKFLASGQHEPAFYQSMWRRLNSDGRWEGEIVNRRKDGGTYVGLLRISVIADSQGRPRRFVGLFGDVTEKKRKEEIVWHQANFDPLTGLPNRQLLEDRMERAIAQAYRRHTNVALLFIDLDRFKPVNDEFGHAVGDELLRQVAKRLQYALRDEDTVARLGGDEFVAVLPDRLASDTPAKTADKIVTVLSEPFRIGDHILEISCSIGIALFPQDADSAATLIDSADAAMYRAKEAGRSTWRSA
jgi:diguanylate cyclase (GGDEF)-like protein/PAS domain S-box-containing protein